MIERHYDDEALISLLETNRIASDVHLPSCEPCSAKIESFRMIADALADGDVWDSHSLRSEPVPSTIANLRAFADQMAHEESRAEATLRELLAGSREEWMPRLNAHPEWWTAGVVRKLVDLSYEKVFSMPPDAVTITEMATGITESLEPVDYASDTVERLRGSAWRAHAYALYYIGDFRGAETALTFSERQFQDCMINEYELARVDIVKALVFKPFARWSEAEEAAERSVKTFERFADVAKTVSARITQAHLLFGREQFQKAAALLDETERMCNGIVSVETHVAVLSNLAYAYRRLGQTDLAISYYAIVSSIYDEKGMLAESARIRWNCADVLAGAGKMVEAESQFAALAIDFEKFGMTSECALVSLHRAEILLTQGRFEDVERLCRSAMSLFEKAGLSYSTRALTALAFIQEASQQKKASAIHIKEVRDYLKRLPAQPNLLFAPSPLSLDPPADY